MAKKIRGVKIGKISTFFQSKTLIPSSKNQIFQKFLTALPASSYERRATKNGYIFVSNVQLRLIIEPVLSSVEGGVFFYPEFTPSVCSLAFLSGASGKKKRNSKLVLSGVEGPMTV